MLFAVFSTSVATAFQDTSDQLEKVYTTPTNDPFPEDSFLTDNKKGGAFPLVTNGNPTDILVSSDDFDGVQRVAKHFQTDLKYVSGSESQLLNSQNDADNLIIVGTLGESPIIDELVQSGKIKVDQLQGKWEKFLIIPVKKPFDNVKNGLVIVGSDKRGSIYGMFELSGQMGVSPWYWWADVPVKRRENVYVKNAVHTMGEPKVKYRGIFINDEAPALRNWAKEKFGDFNSAFYQKVYEMILRNKGNYLWPAMWRPSVFATDDPNNASLADEYGVVISTTHHEPMMRYHEEWSRYDGGAWNYETNAENLQEFWQGGIERMGDKESLVTLGMRGDGDEAMGESTAVKLLKEVIADQREIIADVTGKPAEETPQVWALYKEVQDYYDKGMRVDDDILILFCDDNWGNVRILPKKEDLDHSGGYGMYYHFDYVGGPVSYRWLNVTQIERVWEQMNLSYEWGVEDLWIVNVGDIKPMEFPISFFLDFAWNPESIQAKDLPNYYTNWANQQFGATNKDEIAEILSLSTKYNARRTPEMVQPDTYSLSNYREAERVSKEYADLLERSEKVYNALENEKKDAYYQLVHFPLEIRANLNEMYVAAGKNQMYSNQQRASTNKYGDVAKEKFFKDRELVDHYHNELADGKWNHIMSQTHIGYTSWNNPPVDKMPSISYLQVPNNASLGYVVENGEESRWSKNGLYSRSFPTFDRVNDQEYYIEIFNKGEKNLEYTLESENDWINISSTQGSIDYEEKIYVKIDWDKVPANKSEGSVVITGAGQDFTVTVPLMKEIPSVSGFVENNGVVSIEASEFSDKSDARDIKWVEVPNMGRTASAMTIQPADAKQQEIGKNTPKLEYEFTIFEDGDLNVETYLSPTLNYKKNEGLKYAIAIDDEAPQIINIHEGDNVPDWEYPDWWNNSVTDHIRKKQSTHSSVAKGVHTLKIWMIDPGVVFQKFVIDAGGLKPSYLGPPASLKK